MKLKNNKSLKQEEDGTLMYTYSELEVKCMVILHYHKTIEDLIPGNKNDLRLCARFNDHGPNTEKTLSIFAKHPLIKKN